MRRDRPVPPIEDWRGVRTTLTTPRDRIRRGGDCMRSRNARAQTSVDILRERDALQARLRAVDAALAGIEAEARRALHEPETSAMALSRVARLVRQARQV